jgi:glycosyltransferase involved in cell wall biosynthesis
VNTRLTICLLSHERPTDVLRAIESILQQSDRDFDFWVSENSFSDQTSEAIATHYPQVRVVRRQPVLPALEHFNTCIDEISTTHFCLFHDDDLMGPDFVLRIKQQMAAHPHASALAVNAQVETDGVRQDKPSFSGHSPVQWLESPTQLAQRYFSKFQPGIAPFPGYVYNKPLLGNLRFDLQGGKYSDVAWLLQVCQRGVVGWISDPLMVYRIHGSNDGLSESRRDRLRFWRFLRSHAPLVHPEVMEDYRSFMHKKFLDSARLPASRSNKIRRHLKAYRVRRLMRVSHYRAWLLRQWQR